MNGQAADKIIYHVDVNSAFLSWEACYRREHLGETTDLRELPSAVAGDREARHGIILAKSVPAKKMGVKTGEPIWQAKRKCPGLILVPPDYSLYVAASRRFIALLRDYAPLVEQYSIDEAYVDVTGCRGLYGPPVEAAYELKERIHRELGFTVNVGVSCNKLLAKMAGELEKPDKVHTLFPQEIAAKLWPLPVGELFSVGPASQARLSGIGVTTIGQLARLEERRIRALLGRHGVEIWNYANGRGPEELAAAVPLNKGYGISTTLPADITRPEQGCKVLLSLCETVGARLRADGQSGRCVTVHLRTADFYDWSHQVRLEQPSDATLEIWQAACRALRQMWRGGTPLRQLGVAVSQVSRENSRQLTLFGDRYDKLSRLDAAVDGIRRRYGEDSLRRACFLQQDGVGHMAGGLHKERRTGVTKPLDEEEEYPEDEFPAEG